MSKDKKVDEAEARRLREGYRRANHAALYAHVRVILANSLTEENPTVGLHGVVITEQGQHGYFSAGGTPRLEVLLAAFGTLQGSAISSAVARLMGDAKAAQTGDEFDPALGVTRCVGCEDGDPVGDHAREELRRNGRAWLGLTIEVAERFYGEHLSDKAKALLTSLKAEALPMNENVS